MIKTIVLSGIAMLFAFGMAYEFTELTEIKHRASAYFVCFLCVFTGSVLFGLIIAAPVSPGDEDYQGNVAQEYQPGLSLAKRDELITNLFLVTIVPALLGVRFALGKPPSRTPQD